MFTDARTQESLLIRNARVLTWDDERSEHLRGDILIENGLIAAIGPNLSVTDEFAGRILEADGLLASPGLINAHVHSSGNLMRGTLDGLPLEVFMLYEVPPLAQSNDSSRLDYLRSALGAMEMLKLGITSVLDDAFFVPLASVTAIDAILGAYRDSGIRATVALDQTLVVEYEKYPYLREMLPEPIRHRMDQAPRETEAGMLLLYRHLIETWHGAAHGRLTAAVSCSAPQRAPESYLKALSALSRSHDLPYFCHLLETRVQRVLGEERYGRSLIRYAHDIGILDERMLAIHTIWIDDDDIALLAASRCTVAHNPVCNLRLGSGIMPFRKLRDAGVAIALGTDEAVSDDSHSVWGAAKLAGLIHTLADADYRQWPSATEVLDCIWRGGAQAMRRNGQVGVLRPGACADIALLDLTSDAFTPLNSIARQLVYSETGASVRHTIVAGVLVVENGHVTTLDEAAIKSELRSMRPEMSARNAALRKEAAMLEPYYRDMYLRCALKT